MKYKKILTEIQQKVNPAFSNPATSYIIYIIKQPKLNH